jgi:glycosyltransferase involved in cell wall biosynthesis
VRFLRDVRTLRQTIDRELFDVVHCHSSHDHYVAAAACRAGTPRVVRTIHNLKHARGDLLSRMLFQRTDAFAFANRAIADKFGRGGPVLPPVVDPIRFSPWEEPSVRRRALGVPDGAFVVGTVGKLAEGRGHREAIEAAAAIPSAILLHVGKGELRPELEALAAALGTADRNVWVGYADEDLPELYQAMDVFLFPASGSEQGQRALLEAMASGVPVVAVDVPGVEDLVTDGRDGLVVSAAAGLVPALERLRSDAVLRREIGGRGRARALEFGAASFAAAASAFYAGLLERKSSTSRAWDATETEG